MEGPWVASANTTGKKANEMEKPNALGKRNMTAGSEDIKILNPKPVSCSGPQERSQRPKSSSVKSEDLVLDAGGCLQRVLRTWEAPVQLHQPQCVKNQQRSEKARIEAQGDQGSKGSNP